ncbi:Alpha/Beta hydrolase protein [Cercophora scortea]|uniref:Alpha/Beta hydrolase protein n=1 Tax=Cercophora scortea TaxID=314031 RepID=A0AAE0IGD2_9PEZI|nr:Alpha/Beta hydrolase protein [Cercophora scortea]
MCDFSSYGGPSEEWLALEATLDPVPDFTLEGLQERKAATNEWREAAAALTMKTLAPHVRLQNHSIPARDGQYNIEARSYRPADIDPAEPLPVYMHLHGGGFLFGTLAAEDATCSKIAINARVAVLNVNYRHTPENVYPTAWHDAQDAFEWLHDHIALLGGDAQQVVVGGISAGGQLTASLVLEKHLGRIATSRPPIAGQLLMIPCMVHTDCYGPQLAEIKDPSVSSYQQCKDAPILPVSVCHFFLNLLQIENPDTSDTKLNPGNASPSQVKGLPPTAFGIAGMDPLRDEGLLYAKKLIEAGVPTDVSMFRGLPHGFSRFGDKLSACKRWDEVMERGIRWTLGNPAPSSVFEIKSD